MKQEVVAVQERYLQSQSNLLEETEAKVLLILRVG